MRPQPRTPMWIRLRRTKIIYRETNFARKTNRLLLPTYRYPVLNFPGQMNRVVVSINTLPPQFQ